MLRLQEIRTISIIETEEKERKRIAQDLHDVLGLKLTIVKINFEKLKEVISESSPENKIIFEQTANIMGEMHKEVHGSGQGTRKRSLCVVFGRTTTEIR